MGVGSVAAGIIDGYTGIGVRCSDINTRTRPRRLPATGT